jgi:hypothetical protein
MEARYDLISVASSMISTSILEAAMRASRAVLYRGGTSLSAARPLPNERCN